MVMPSFVVFCCMTSQQCRRAHCCCVGAVCALRVGNRHYYLPLFSFVESLCCKKYRRTHAVFLSCFSLVCMYLVFRYPASTLGACCRQRANGLLTAVETAIVIHYTHAITSEQIGIQRGPRTVGEHQLSSSPCS